MTTLDVHRLLDEAFAGVDMTPDAQDLKEEMRADLVVRVSELESSGLTAAEAARQAIANLGDIRSIMAEMRTVTGTTSPWNHNRVRPKPAFVVRTVLVATLTAAALATAVFGAISSRIPMTGLWIAVAGLAVTAGVLVADGLRQETTSNYPMPLGRAVGYGAATVLTVAGLGTAAPILRDQQLPWMVGGAVALLAGTVAFTYFGATQTNRHKPWVLRMYAAHEGVGDRFERDPAAAARFGIYTAVVWIVASAAFAVLGFAVSWAWSWLALVAGLVIFFLMLARMLFAPESSVDRPAPMGHAAR